MNMVGDASVMNANQPEPAERRILIAVRRVIRAVDQHSRRLMEQHGLTGPQFAALQELNRVGITLAGELARALQMSQPTLTGILDRLERRGLAARSRNGADRRTVQVAITDEGKRVLRETPSALQEGVRRELAKLDEWERTMMLATLQRLAAIVTDALPTTEDTDRDVAEAASSAPQ
jgi:DNA-binding MarR family transcriptional regulator